MAYIIVKTKSTFFGRLNQVTRLGYLCLITFVFSNFLSNITPSNSYPPYAKANEPATLLSLGESGKRSIFTAKADDMSDVPCNCSLTALGCKVNVLINAIIYAFYVKLELNVTLFDWSA